MFFIEKQYLNSIITTKNNIGVASLSNVVPLYQKSIVKEKGIIIKSPLTSIFKAV